MRDSLPNWPTYSRKGLAIGFILMIFTGFLISRALMSIGMIALACVFILNIDIRENARRYILFKPFPLFGYLANTAVNFDLGEQFRRFWKHKDFVALVFFFFVIAAGGFWSEDLANYGDRMRIKLPFLALPLCSAAIPAFNLKEFKLILYGLIALLLMSAGWVLFNYLQDMAAMHERFKFGKGIPVPMNHIRYSLMLAFAAISALYFLLEQRASLVKWEKVFLWSALLFFTAFLHLLSVRSGLLALYIGFAYMIVRLVFVYRKWLIGGIGAALLIIVPILSYQYLPSVRTKIDYMRWDLQMYLQDVPLDYSDTRRLMSIEIGLAIAKENLLLGVGTGDLQPEVIRYYETHFQDIDPLLRKYPHNQFVYTLAANGIIGLLALLLAFGLPFFYRKNYRNPLLAIFLLMVGSSFLTEHTIEVQLGAAFTLTVLVVLLNFQKGLGESTHGSS